MSWKAKTSNFLIIIFSMQHEKTKHVRETNSITQQRSSLMCLSTLEQQMLTNDTNQGELQELVENSLNVDTTMISVIVNNEGLKLIPASNDGHGILYEDLPILCERHITSKLSTFDDLQTIKSMGFRVEALDSMTYVGHVTVTTITEGQLHGYRCLSLKRKFYTILVILCYTFHMKAYKHHILSFSFLGLPTEME